MLQTGSADLQKGAGMAWEWSDIRCFLAVAEAGTTLGAARALAMNQTTCARRIAALETALRLKLFDRSASGYALTPEGAALLPAARSFGDCAAAFERAASSARAAGIGVLRVTTNDGMADSIVTPAIVRFRTLHPDVLVDLNITDRLVDLASGEADIAIRGSLEAGGGPGLIQRRLPDLYWGF
jgi:DNA-binding transcriptional LysR family regulator